MQTCRAARFIPITYRFFAANMLLFAVGLHCADPRTAVWVGRVFFIWISVFNLFVVSVFWALIVDIFNSEQGKRLFGFIAAGATLGAIVGSAVTASLARYVSELLAAARRRDPAGSRGVLRPAAVAPVAASLNQRPHAAGPTRRSAAASFAASRMPFKSPYLVNVSLFMLLFAITSTFLYFEQAAIVQPHASHGRGAQTAFFATLDLAVNVLTLVVQLFLTGRIVRCLGVGVTLALLPGAQHRSASARWPCMPTLRRWCRSRCCAAPAISRSRARRAKCCYTVVPREDRYKAKSFIDTVVYRPAIRSAHGPMRALQDRAWHVIHRDRCGPARRALVPDRPLAREIAGKTRGGAEILNGRQRREFLARIAKL